jgi:hypothetical protein
MTARVYRREHTFSGSIVMEASEVFDQYEQELFTSVVATAEKEDKPVSLLVVPATNVFDAIVVTAQRLGLCVVSRTNSQPMNKVSSRETLGSVCPSHAPDWNWRSHCRMVAH